MPLTRNAFISPRVLCVLVLGLALATGGGAALAQNAVRGAATGPPQSAATGKNVQAKGHAPAADGQETPAALGKFPNKDTAKNRRDYELGTGAESIEIGRDEASGDTVMRSNPPKKQQDPSPLEMQPVQVWPVVPGQRGR